MGVPNQIRWTEEELDAIMSEANRLWKDTPSLTVLNLVRKAQQKLPTHRRKHLSTLFTVPKSLRFRLEKAKTNGALQEQKPVVPVLPEVPPPALPSVETAIEQLAERIAEQLAKKLHFFLKQRAAGILQSAAAEAVHSDITRKRKVLVVGGLSSQNAMLQQEFGKLLDLRFKGADMSPSMVALAAKEADATVAWVEFLDHKMTDSLTAAGIKYHAVYGGLTHLREKLEEIYCL